MSATQLKFEDAKFDVVRAVVHDPSQFAEVRVTLIVLRGHSDAAKGCHTAIESAHALLAPVLRFLQLTRR